MVGYTQAMNRELLSHGIKSCALCPAFVDTPMAGFVKVRVGAKEMIAVADVVESMSCCGPRVAV